MFKRILLYFYHKIKHRHLVKFWLSSYMSHRCKFEGMNVIYRHSFFLGNIGLCSYIGNYCHLTAYIGRFTSIGNNVSQIIETHPIKAPFVSTSPCFYSLKKQCGETFAKKQSFEEYRYYDKEKQIAIKIGNDCWIGNHVCFIGGIVVGDGAVVLAHALVSKDVPPYAIVGGVPAKVIGYRYDEETISFLQKIQWWNNSEEWLKKYAYLMNDLNKLKEYYKAHGLL